MTHDIFIVSFHRDFDYLRFCLRSIQKFVPWINNVVLVLPTYDREASAPLLAEFVGKLTLKVVFGEEWPKKGLLWHEWRIINADADSDADYIWHVDSDCCFTESTTVEDYVQDGKPVLQYIDFASVSRQAKAAGSFHWRAWHDAVKLAIGVETPVETMRRFPEVYRREIYPLARRLISEHTQMDAERYIRSCKNEFPQTFAEFPLLGAVAWEHYRDKYIWAHEKKARPPSKCFQGWSHWDPRPLEIEMYKKLGVYEPL